MVYFLKPKTDILLTNKTFVFSFLPNIHVMGHILGQFFFHYLPSLEEGKKNIDAGRNISEFNMVVTKQH